MSEHKAVEIIKAHIGRVGDNMTCISQNIMQRGIVHDKSKLEDFELPYHKELIEEFGKHPFGSVGYDETKKKLGPAINHHFKHNRHHPEHFVDGIEGMNLLDLIEMLCDWKAATQNHPTVPGNMHRSMELGIKRYNISPQLARILYNTVNDCNLG